MKDVEMITVVKQRLDFAEALAERISRLNRNNAEIGHGMLCSLIDDANLVLKNRKIAER